MRNRIRELRERLGLSQGALGDAIGAHWQTVQRIEKQSTRIMPKRERALADYFGMEIDDLYVKNDKAGFRSVVVCQHVEAGIYAESNIWPPDEGYEVAVPDVPDLAMVELHGCEVRGESMNKVYPVGTVLVYSDFEKRCDKLVSGKHYIVERTRVDGLRESTVKKLWKDDLGHLWLLPESTDPRFVPIPVNGVDGDTVRIIGRVEFSVRRE